MKLPDSVANRIAAGEVIERPASMLKELLENAIDSKADNIEVYTQESGIKSMIVEDNGEGIKFEELPLAISHHATSKIHSIEDLDSINTLGFRGEALASISDVTNLEIISKNANENNGGKIIVEGGKIIEHKPAAASKGTKIIAKNLFFNIPARYKFLKHTSREFFLMKEVFDMEALVQPNISMRLTNNGRLAISYAKAKSLKDRIENYLNDNDIFSNLIEINIEKENISIYGLFSNSKISQSIKKNNFIFLNNRPIENRAISFAIKNAYSNAIPKERYPFYFLYINIDCNKVDVNVHPSKKEVRIKNERETSAMIYNEIFNKINEGSYFSSVNIETDIESTPIFKIQNNENYANQYNNYNNTKEYYNSYQIKEFSKFAPERDLREFGEYTKAVGQIFSSYIVAERGEEMYIIDQHAAYERLNYERIYKTLTKGKLEYEKLLVPCEIEYRDYEIDILNSHKETIEAIGIKFETNSKNSIIIEEVPIYMPKNQKIEKMIKFRVYSSSIRISRIWQAAFATGVPGPKIAATPALYRKS